MLNVPDDLAFVQPTGLQLSMSRKYLNPDLIIAEGTENEIKLFRPSSTGIKNGWNDSSGYEVDGKKYLLMDINSQNCVFEAFTFKVSNEQLMPALVETDVKLLTHVGYVISSNVVALFQ